MVKQAAATSQEVLKEYFGYDQFWPLQSEIIDNVLQKHDTLAVMPTGGGKSLCYQIPAMLFPGLSIVVSPLIALMKDQVEQLHENGIPALFLNSSLSYQEYQENMVRVRSGQVKLLYLAPEALLTPRIFNLLSGIQVDCLAIDEAHCISEWGHDFRPEYRQLAEVRKRFPEAVCLALTATATKRVRQDILASLNFSASNEFVASFDRKNLMIEVVPKSDPITQTLDFLKGFPDKSGIIYCFSRRQVDELAIVLNNKGHNVRPYHAGLENEERRANQEAFIRDDTDIIVATIAFGMGINKPDVRFIVHYDLPKSIESYYQEIGRAGRDGLAAHCLLLYSYGDVQKLRYFIEQKDDAERRVAYQHLDALTGYAESTDCRRIPLLAYFGENYGSDSCGMCDNCLDDGSSLEDISAPALKFLSCVKQTGELFGAAHIAAVLRGSKSKKVLKFGHEGLSTYGIGRELARKEWQQVGRQLVQKKLLFIDPRHRSLKITKEGHAFLRDETPLMGVITPETPRRSKKGKAGEIEHDRALFGLLRSKRKELADDAGVPPYVIFSDRTLIEMAAYLPGSDDSFLAINGVGKVKLARYGEVFMGIISEYSREKGLTEKPKQGVRQWRTPTTGRHLVVGEAFNNGQSVQDLMAHFQVMQITILDHLTRYTLEGYSLRADGGIQALSKLPDEKKNAVLAAFEDLGTEYLKPVYEQLNESVPYDDLRILRLHFLSTRKEEQ